MKKPHLTLSPFRCGFFLKESSIMPQTILDFDLASTQDTITPRAGVIVLGEYIKGLGLEKLCNSHLPLPQSNRGFMLLHSGGRVIEDIKAIQIDEALRKSLKLKNVPTSSAILKWLSRVGLMGIYGIESINKTVLLRHLKRVKDDLILDIDASVIESNKWSAWSTYKECVGYTPMIGHINGGYLIHHEFRDGNMAPAYNNLEFIQRCIAQLPKDRELSWLRADSASYQTEIFNYCDTNKIDYAIGAKISNNVMREIEAISNWQKLPNGEYVGEFIHTMPKAHNAFRVIVTKRVHTPMLPHLTKLFSAEELETYNSTRYHAIATNNNTLSPQEIIELYRQRANSSENSIKELKSGFNLDYLPTSNFISNALYFAIGTLAYNISIVFKTILDTKLQHHTIKTIRYKIYSIAGKLITHARQTILKVPKAYLELLQKIRQRSYEVCIE